MTEDEKTTFTTLIRDSVKAVLRTCGVELYNDVGNRMRPDGAEEHRIVSIIARTVAENVAAKYECQTIKLGSAS